MITNFSTTPQDSQKYNDIFTSHARARAEGEGRAWRVPDVTLSIAHIRPQGLSRVEWFENSSFLKVHSGRVKEFKGGGKRSKIFTFSSSSRRRLIHTIAKVDKTAALPLFVTLTYPAAFPTNPLIVKSHLSSFIKRLKRRFHKAGLIWKMEPQERGAAHFHLLIWGCEFKELYNFVPEAWFEIAGGGDQLHLNWHKGLLGRGNVPCVQVVRSQRGVWSYTSKYLGKVADLPGWSGVGRFWGVSNRKYIPFGESRITSITGHQANILMRYQKRFMQGTKKTIRAKKYKIKNTVSRICFCDASQWISRLL